MLEIAIQAAGRSVTLGDLPSILGARRAYEEIGDMVEALIAQMDILAGDTDLEETDAEDAFWLSPMALGFDAGRGPGCEISDPDNCLYDEDEEDDPSGQMDEDDCNTGDGKLYLHGTAYHGPGCLIGDSDACPVFDRH